MLLLPVTSDSEVPEDAGVEAVGHLGFCYLGPEYNDSLLCGTDKQLLYIWMNSFLSLALLIFIYGWECLLFSPGVLSGFISVPRNIKCVEATDNTHKVHYFSLEFPLLTKLFLWK